MRETLQTSLPISERTVGELVAEDYRRARVMKQYGLEFCCGGGVPLGEACRRKDLSVEQVASALASVERDPADPLSMVSRWSPSFLADYIEVTHHTYVREAVPPLRAFTQKVARVHGHAVPELVDIAEAFDALADELESHMAYEETVLFPAVRSADPAVADRLGRAEEEHVRAGDLMAEIRCLSNDFTPPDWACATYRASFANLREFEEDLHRHVHLENNVLFARLRTAAVSPPPAAEPRAAHAG